MSAYVFVGPTLPCDRARTLLDAVFLPPAAQGDVYRVASLRLPRAIGIVDGYFQQVPAVWHKEILWALAQGVAVFGAASMGALRAAELAPFGMRGIGRIFEGDRDGLLTPFADLPFEDDDEVAIVHGPPETGYLAVSEAMVNIRLSLEAARVAGVIDGATSVCLTGIAKGMFYAERTYPELLSRARGRGVEGAALDALAAWLPAGRVDQKRSDAEAMLRAMARYLAAGEAPDPPAFALAHTTQWEAALAAIEAPVRAGAPALEELGLEGAPYFHRRARALARLLAIPAPEAGERVSEALRRALGAPRRDELAARIQACSGAPAAAADLWADEHLMESLRRSTEAMPAALLERHMLADLEADGTRARLEARARAKALVIDGLSMRPRGGDLEGPGELQLHDWYFSRRLGRDIPEDLPAYVASLGFDGLDTFNDAVLREFAFLEHGADAAIAADGS